MLEALFKDVEKKVPGFQRLHGEYFNRACRKYAQMKSGSQWKLKDDFHQEALNILAGKSAAASAPAGELCNAFTHCESLQGGVASACWHLLSASRCLQSFCSMYASILPRCKALQDYSGSYSITVFSCV